jgi:hypothetical protein
MSTPGTVTTVQVILIRETSVIGSDWSLHCACGAMLATLPGRCERVTPLYKHNQQNATIKL